MASISDSIARRYASGMPTVGYCLVVFGIFMIIISIYAWKKQKITWQTSYSHVKKRDVAAFMKLSGISGIGIGLTFITPGIFLIFKLLWPAFIAFGICTVFSMTIYFIAQHKYNG